MVFIAAGWQVAGIKLNFDPNLKTDMPIKEPFHIWEVKTYPNGRPEEGNRENVVKILKADSEGITVKRGEEIGMFRFGSATAVLFEAKSNWQWRKKVGDNIVYGEVIGSNQ